MIIIGLVIVIAAVVVGAAGVLSNSGSSHPLTHSFGVLGYHVTGSTGTLFLYGIVVGAAAMFGLSVLLVGARRTSRRGREARRGLRQSRRETASVSQDRDDLLDQRETARAYTASAVDDGPAASSPGLAGDTAAGQPGKWRLFAPRGASAQAAAQPVPAANGRAANGRAADPPADASASPD